MNYFYVYFPLAIGLLKSEATDNERIHLGTFYCWSKYST